MTRDELDARYTFVIRKWGRTIADMGETVPRGLLDDLALIAGHHAITSAAESVERPAADDLGRPVRPDGAVIPETAGAVERRAARVRGARPSGRTAHRTTSQ